MPQRGSIYSPAESVVTEIVAVSPGLMGTLALGDGLRKSR